MNTATLSTMTRWATAAMAVVLLLAGACSSQERNPVADRPAKDSTTSERSGKTRAPDSRAVANPADYSADRFGDSADVDHRWYPLQPGTLLVYKGSSLEEGERLQHGVKIIVTDLTKRIDGVENVVVWERDYTEGQLVESELALFAQDKLGHIWHMGEYPEEYEGGKLDATPAWVHGLKGATAGITIPAEPRTGTPDYAQGYAPPPINWVDRGRVYRTGVRTCVPAGCYDDVVIIEEFERHLKQSWQDKYYAPGVGVVRVGWRGAKDDSKEVLKLVEERSLTPTQMDAARSGALKLEDRAYRINKAVFGSTPRSQVRDR